MPICNVESDAKCNENTKSYAISNTMANAPPNAISSAKLNRTEKRL